MVPVRSGQANVVVLAREVGHPHALAWTVAAAAIKAWAECRLPAAAELCEKAAALFYERCADIFHEVGTLEVWFNLHVNFLMGRLDTVSRRASKSWPTIAATVGFNRPRLPSGSTRGPVVDVGPLSSIG